MRKPPIIATMLLLMGILLVPACDEDKGTDPLALAALYNSKYYLEFDADYDNDGTVDEHVKMRVREPFRYLPVGESLYWYMASFSNGEYEIHIHLPSETSAPLPINYDDGKDNFNFTYWSNFYIHYSSYETSGTIDSFIFNISRWDGAGGIITASFEGYLYDTDNNKIHIMNGILNARISRLEYN